MGQASTTVDGGNGTDTVCLPKMKAKWNVQFDAGTGTYTCTNGAITDVLRGVETVKGWNGSTLKAGKLY